MRICINCEHFRCKYDYGYAREDPSYISIYCSKQIETSFEDLLVEKVYKEKINEHPTECIWNLSDDVGWNTDDFRNIIKTAINCKFYQKYKGKRIIKYRRLFAKEDGKSS